MLVAPCWHDKVAPMYAALYPLPALLRLGDLLLLLLLLGAQPWPFARWLHPCDDNIIITFTAAADDNNITVIYRNLPLSLPLPCWLLLQLLRCAGACCCSALPTAAPPYGDVQRHAGGASGLPWAWASSCKDHHTRIDNQS